MNRKEANKLINTFWEAIPDSEKMEDTYYMVDYFVEWLYDEGYEICPRICQPTRK